MLLAIYMYFKQLKKQGDQDFEESKGDVWKGLNGGNRREKLLNYIITSRNWEKIGRNLLLFLCCSSDPRSGLKDENLGYEMG